MASNQRQRPVQFRGLSTHYVAGEDIRVTFRYPCSSFQPRSDDKVKLYALDSQDSSVAGTAVGDCSKHRLCDGGLYKAGSVTISTSPLVGRPQRQFVLLYGSGKLRRVLGKSDPFVICPQENLPSIQIRSAEDSAVIDKLRSHSPVGSRAEDELSISVLSGGLSGEWEELEEEEEENSSESESWSYVGEGLAGLGQSVSAPEPLPLEPEQPVVKVEPPSGVTGGKIEEHSTAPQELSEQTAPLERAVELPEMGVAETLVTLKNCNRELKTKVRVLQEKIQAVGQERDQLVTAVKETKDQLSLLQLERSELRQKSKKLTEEWKTVKARNKELERENAMLTQHCAKQLTQMGQYEARLKTLTTENLQLQQQLPDSGRKSRPPLARRDEPVASSGKKQKPAELIASKGRPVIDVYVRDREQMGEVRAPLVKSTSVSGGKELSEEHIKSIMEQLKGGRKSFKCPVCEKVLHSHETEFSVQLHVEHCLRST